LKKTIFLLCFSWLGGFGGQAQSTDRPAYTFFYNKAPHNARYPLIGLVNIGLGSHTSFQLGLYNHTKLNFFGFQLGVGNQVDGHTVGGQLGLINIAQHGLMGSQIGILNSVYEGHRGVQVGGVNFNSKIIKGAQLGCWNVTSGVVFGAQLGFVNGAQNIVGLQVGYINVAIGKVVNPETEISDSSQSVPFAVYGAQLGLGNLALEDISGFQVGGLNQVGSLKKGLLTETLDSSRRKEFYIEGGQLGALNLVHGEASGFQIGVLFNLARTLSGVQLGLINITDTVSSGIAIGFLSFVKHGGYTAFEVAVSEYAPISFAFKTGFDRFYTGVQLSHLPFGNSRPFLFGWLAGTRLRLGSRFDFNPEFIHSISTFNSLLQVTALRLQFGFQLTPQWSLLAGPSFTWMKSDGEFTESYFAFWRAPEVSGASRMLTARLGFVYQFR
jgi:hypothetical protein